MAKLLGIGNPILDISAEVPASLLEKYGLQGGNAILAEEKHLPLYPELLTYNVSYIAGGAAQNSVRACQWLLQEPGATAYIGCVGSDEYGTILETKASADGVAVHYLKDAETPTGTCAVLIVDKERSMVANLGAANKYQASHLEAPERQALIQSAQVFCATGFFLTVAPQCLVSIGKHAAEANKPFLLNIGAPFIYEFFSEPLLQVFPYVDYLIGNQSEILGMGAKFNLGSDVVEITKKLATMDKVNKNRPRIVVCTQGPENAVVAIGDSTCNIQVPANRVPEEEIVDLNGAGDSFCGGFLAGLVLNKPIEESIRAGHYVASVTIRSSGTDFEGKKPEFAWA